MFAQALRRTCAHVRAHHHAARIFQQRGDSTCTARHSRCNAAHHEHDAHKPQQTSTTGADSYRYGSSIGGHALTCAVEATADRSAYDVCIFPHWNLSLGTVERFVGPGGALQRHAEIASRLRESGWVAQYSAAEDTDIAA
jgi:hypothetical protein